MKFSPKLTPNLFLVLGCLLLTQCTPDDLRTSDEISREQQQALLDASQRLCKLKHEIKELENKKDKYVADVKVLEAQTNKEKLNYLVTFEIYISRVSLDIWSHIKDAANTGEVTLSVSEDLYNAVKVGQDISSSFRGGSFLVSGTFSTLNMKVTKKQIKVANERGS